MFFLSVLNLSLKNIPLLSNIYPSVVISTPANSDGLSQKVSYGFAWWEIPQVVICVFHSFFMALLLLELVWLSLLFVGMSPGRRRKGLSEGCYYRRDRWRMHLINFSILTCTQSGINNSPDVVEDAWRNLFSCAKGRNIIAVASAEGGQVSRAPWFNSASYICIEAAPEICYLGTVISLICGSSIQGIYNIVYSLYQQGCRLLLRAEV